MTKPVDCILIWWLRGTRYKWSRLGRRLFEGRYRSKEMPGVNSLGDVAKCLRKVIWTRDKPWHLFHFISYRQTVWTKKKDDCDGFAILAAALLAQCAPEANPVLVTVMVRPIQKGHTVCCFRWGDSLWYFDNHILRKYKCRTYSDVVAKTARGKRLVCWDVVDPVTLETIEFHVV